MMSIFYKHCYQENCIFSENLEQKMIFVALSNNSSSFFLILYWGISLYFCYYNCRLCLGAWSDHGERTGGFYACNRYEAAKQEGVVMKLKNIFGLLKQYFAYYRTFCAIILVLRLLFVENQLRKSTSLQTSMCVGHLNVHASSAEYRIVDWTLSYLDFLVGGSPGVIQF